MKNLRIGVAGLGRGKKFVDIFSQIDGCEVVAVCDPVAKCLEPYSHLATHADFDDFLREGLDVVAVITPGPVHAEQSIKAMTAGAHVLCETPCIYSAEEAAAVVDCAKRTGKTFMLAEDYIWLGWVTNLKKKVDEGFLGEIIYAEGDYTHDCRDYMLVTDEGTIPYAEWHRHPDAKKTWRATDLPPLFYTSHTLGPLLYLMQDRVEAVVGMSTGCRTAPDLGTTDLEVGLFETGKGNIIRLTNGFSLAHPMATYYSLCGTKGSVKMQRAHSATFIWYSEQARPAMNGWQPAPEEWLERPDGENPVAVMVGEFVESIVNKTPPPIDVYRSIDFVLPGITAHESAQHGGQKMAVPNPRG